MRRQISDRQLSLLSEYITLRLGLHFPQKRWRDLERIIVNAAAELGFPETGECIERIVAGQLAKEQEEILAGHLTIGETYFFREQKSFDVLEQRILPELIESRRGKEQRLRIWSAGCSTGEEPYSLAILISRLIPDLRDWNISILATDINNRALAKAAHGVYGEWSFRGVPEWIRQRHFTRTPDGRLELPHAIRRMVNFAVLNLAQDSYPSLATNTNAMDIILCRNVLMYFGQQQQRQVIDGFRRSLLEGGWLVVSPCETSPLFSARFVTVMFPGAVFYKKGDQVGKTDGMAPSLPAAAPARFTPPAGQPDSPVFSPAAPEKVKQTIPPAEPSPYEEAMTLYRQGSYGEAADRLSGLLLHGEASGEALPMFGKAASLLARTLANKGDIGMALEWTEKAIAVDKLNAELYYLRATILQEQGSVSPTIASLKQALYIDHDFVPAHFALGTLTLQLGKRSEAERHFGNALSLLGRYRADDPVPGAEGMTAARLAEIIAATRESMKVK
ncbi:MAG: chemotaxis protein CheR [Deltaproteobacteria bacterium]|nr:chemotaxis protein CheR [Deltaproteobacteria bacterium]